MPDLSLWEWSLGVLCALLVGVAKTGVPGIGAFIVPLMVLTVGDARFAAAWLVPMLSTGDVFAISYWHRHAEVRKLLSLVPSVAVGMAGGGAALALPEAVLRRGIAVIVLAMVVLTIRGRRAPLEDIGRPHLYGIGAGFASTVANAAGPVMNMYLLACRLPKEQFVATAAWFFLFVNLSKMPIYWSYGLFSRESLTFDLTMVPIVVLGGFLGIWAIHRIPQKTFEVLIVALTVLAAIALFV